MVIAKFSGLSYLDRLVDLRNMMKAPTSSPSIPSTTDVQAVTDNTFNTNAMELLPTFSLFLRMNHIDIYFRPPFGEQDFPYRSRVSMLGK